MRLRFAQRFCRILLLLCPLLATAQVDFRFNPSVITTCQNGLGQGTLTWSAPTGLPVQIRVDSAQGPAMTGIEPSQGSETTGPWVKNRQMFYLVTTDGRTLTTTTAQLNCGGSPDTLRTYSDSASWMPLQVGNQWVYDVGAFGLDRTAGYVTWRITGTQTVNGLDYFVLEQSNLGNQPNALLLRLDAQGRYYQIRQTGTQLSAESLWLDPVTRASEAELHAGIPFDPGTIDPAWGFPARQLNYSGIQSGGVLTGYFTQGIGITSFSIIPIDPSGTGPANWSLVEAKINGVLRFSRNKAAVELSTAQNSFNTSQQQTPNCVRPCTLLIGCPVTPSYLPCFGANLRIADPAASQYEGQYTVQMSLLNAGGTAVYQSTRPLPSGQSLGEWLTGQQVPLFTTDGTLLPPGTYQLQASALRPDGTSVGTAQITIRVQ